MVFLSFNLSPKDAKPSRPLALKSAVNELITPTAPKPMKCSKSFSCEMSAKPQVMLMKNINQMPMKVLFLKMSRIFARKTERFIYWQAKNQRCKTVGKIGAYQTNRKPKRTARLDLLLK